jgi:hypothetical protein
MNPWMNRLTVASISHGDAGAASAPSHTMAGLVMRRRAEAADVAV